MSDFSFADVSVVAVQAWVGKEFPDTGNFTEAPLDLPEITGTSRGNQGFPAPTRKRHSSVLAWRIPGTGKPGGLPSMGLHRVRHD